LGARAARWWKAPAWGLFFLLTLLAPAEAAAGTPPSGFRDTVAISGLTNPTAVKFSPDGRVFVAQKSGRILVYSSLDDTTPTLFADLGTKVHDYWDRGLLGFALDPAFPTDPYVYVLYAYDNKPWGDLCPTPPGPLTDGCVVAGRLSRLQAAGDQMTGSEQVLIEGWCQQYPSHSAGDLEFGADGTLYASAGDGASFTFADYGQRGDPVNPCSDPPSEGGALRSQDLRTRSSGDPVTLDGSIIRVDRRTGAGAPGNPLQFDGDVNARRIFAHGFRNPFRLTRRPGTNELWVGDVGWDTTEEINRVPVDSTLRNFGWPCYEGSAAQGTYDALNLPLCEGLFGSPGAVVGPYFSYRHDQAIAGCAAGSSSISGLAFYQGTSYPGYDGALFIADYSRNCIWTMRAGAGGVPDPATRAAFETDANGPVNLELGPGGDVFYVDFTGGTIRRISFKPPVAVATADPQSGPAPLTTQLDGTESTDSDGGHNLTYAWDFDGNGSTDSTAARPIRTFAQGTHIVRLKVTDTRNGGTAAAPVVVSADNVPPQVTIGSPSAGTTWRVGDPIAFSGSAIDPNEGALPSSDLTWQLVLHHCPATCHTHAVAAFDGVANGSFAAPDHDYPSYLELTLTATDSQGLSATKSVRLDPLTVLLRFLTQPVGLQLVVGSTAGPAPLDRTVIVGSHVDVSAPTPQAGLLFAAWSNGGPASQTIVAPSAPMTYTATFASPPQPQPPPPAPPPLPPPPPPPAPVARAPALAPCVVPKLVALRLAAASRALRASRCRLGAVRWVYSRTPRRLVRTQNPRAGRRLRAGAKVAVVVSRGPKPQNR
jgi:glucose/arabinose dehydrogenase